MHARERASERAERYPAAESHGEQMQRVSRDHDNGAMLRFAYHYRELRGALQHDGEASAVARCVSGSVSVGARKRRARRLLRRNGGAGAERSAREKERRGRGSEVTRECGGKPPPFSPARRERQAYNGNNHRVSERRLTD